MPYQAGGCFFTIDYRDVEAISFSRKMKCMRDCFGSMYMSVLRMMEWADPCVVGRGYMPRVPSFGLTSWLMHALFIYE